MAAGFGGGFCLRLQRAHVPQMPGSTTTKALRFRLNEQAAAGINAISASPLNLNLSGDFRVKFKVWINYNAHTTAGRVHDALHHGRGHFGTMPTWPWADFRMAFGSIWMVTRSTFRHGRLQRLH